MRPLTTSKTHTTMKSGENATIINVAAATALEMTINFNLSIILDSNGMNIREIISAISIIPNRIPVVDALALYLYNNQGDRRGRSILEEDILHKDIGISWLGVRHQYGGGES